MDLDVAFKKGSDALSVAVGIVSITLVKGFPQSRARSPQHPNQKPDLTDRRPPAFPARPPSLSVRRPRCIKATENHVCRRPAAHAAKADIPQLPCQDGGMLPNSGSRHRSEHPRAGRRPRNPCAGLIPCSPSCRRLTPMAPSPTPAAMSPSPTPARRRCPTPPACAIYH